MMHQVEMSSGGQISLGEGQIHGQEKSTDFVLNSDDSKRVVSNSNANVSIQEQSYSSCSDKPRISNDKNSKNNSLIVTMFCCVGGAPGLKNIRISYLATTFLASSIIFVFLQELVFSNLTNGYSILSLENGYLFGPPSQVVFDMGALDTNLIRNGQITRLFWSFWLHTGFIHLLINLSSQVILGIILETRWVIWRYVILYFIGGLSGNLASAVLDPCSISAGSSACFFALLAGIIVLLLENWRNSGWQFLYVLFVCLASLVGISLSFMPNTDNWAHIGGFVAGLLWSFSSMESFPRSHSRRSKSNKVSDVEKGSIQESVRYSGSKIDSNSDDGRNKHSYFYQRIIPINCACSGGLQTIRVISFLLLASILTLGFLFLLYKPFYTRFNPALGHLSFSGIQACSCCNSSEGVFWCSSSPTWISSCGNSVADN
ncbi:rhomboid family membrane associated protease [Cryptosporidium bovis]|uniref:rhomboid family membrane associated protease n=1 Tax=Cryptosporidium bovis TaxID=310047 RepID=UPI00351A143B|nr:rhomboid family membrane associated protease [Cryptosporidium bovis]